PISQFVITGRVCEDTNRDGRCTRSEPGVPNVAVSDGLNVVSTNRRGRYVLPAPTAEEAEAGIAIFVTQPNGYRVPLDENNVPQFAYIHKPEGSPEGFAGGPFRFGGLAPTGPLPRQIHFPLIPAETLTEFTMATSGDVQTYSNFELGLFRDSTVAELAARDDLEFYMIQGDVMGDDLSLYERLKEIVATAGVPQYYVHGNHDLDFDAPSDEHSADTFRREWGPEYYSFDVGEVHFVVLDDIFYPCLGGISEVEGAYGGCDDDLADGATYNGVITERQLAWLANDLALVDEDRLVVVSSHIPIHSFIDQNIERQMVDNVVELYETLGCVRGEDGVFAPEDCARPLLALSGHTHTNENIRPGEVYEGWETTLDAVLGEGASPGPAPFPQIVVGAASGSWWSGDFDDAVIPDAFQRLGAPRGYYLFDFEGNEFRDTFKATGRDPDDQMSIDFLTPAFVEWYNALAEWRNANPGPDEAPPVNINDLADTKIVLADEIGESFLHVNVWNGSLDSTVTVSFDGGVEVDAVRVQPGEGENILEALDVYALKRQMMVARHAYVSASEQERADGFELFRASIQCGTEAPSACTPRPLSGFFWADQSSHLWQATLPSDLEIGAHTVEVTTTDRFGRSYSETLTFEVREERPQPFFKLENDPIPVTPVDAPIPQQ
ncbi:MAG: calcineurin-like phosphoesterase C-terminal domain-containing protein, partial [Paracoccaceae bacterium]